MPADCKSCRPSRDLSFKETGSHDDRNEGRRRRSMATRGAASPPRPTSCLPTLWLAAYYDGLVPVLSLIIGQLQRAGQDWPALTRDLNPMPTRQELTGRGWNAKLTMHLMKARSGRTAPFNADDVDSHLGRFKHHGPGTSPRTRASVPGRGMAKSPRSKSGRLYRSLHLPGQSLRCLRPNEGNFDVMPAHSSLQPLIEMKHRQPGS